MPTTPIAIDSFNDDSLFLRAVIDTDGSVILGLRPDHSIFAWNRAAELLYQTPREQAIGMDYVSNFIAPEHRDAVASDIREVLAGKRTHNFEDDSILPDGTRRTLIWNVTAVLAADGQPFGILAIGQDISERKQAEERFRLIFEYAHDGLLIADDTGVVDCNPAALQLLGLTDKSELLGRRPAEFSPLLQPDGTPSREKSRALGKLTKEKGELSFEWEHQRRDGTPVPTSISVQHTIMNSRRVSVVVWRDLSALRALEREREEVQRRLDVAQRMEMVGQLAGGLAHEFNNLLTTVRNAVDLALDDRPLLESTRQDLILARDTATRAAALTRQLLALSKRQPTSVERVDVAAVLRESVPLIRSMLPTSVNLILSPGDAAVVVDADRSQLEHVLLNLVLNARDAMDKGGDLFLSLVGDVATRQVSLIVRDTGAGMDRDTLARIFEPFFTTKPVGSGTGLGLAVVYGAVTHAGGTVRADSTPGEGSTLTVTLPMSAVHVIADDVPVGAEKAGARKVLLVDDDDAVRTTTRRMLQRDGWQVIEACDGEEGWTRFEAVQHEIDVVLSDVRMPRLDGIAFANRIRTLRPDFPIVFFSGYDAIDQRDASEIENVEYLQKPYSRPALAAALRAAMLNGARVASASPESAG